MNILVIGNSPTKRPFYDQLADIQGTRVRYCPTESEAISVLRLSPGPWAGILLESACGQRDNIALARTLRTVYAKAPILFVRHFREDCLDSASSAPSHCTIERTADGEYLLHCALRNTESTQETDTPTCDGQFDSPWVFEFSAPCKVSR